MSHDFQLLKFDPPKEEPAEPCVNAIQLCELILAELKSGEAVGAAFVVVRTTGGVSTSYAGDDCFHQLSSGAARLSHRLMSEWEDTETETQ